MRRADSAVAELAAGAGWNWRFCHGVSVEIFHELLETEQAKGELSDLTKAAFGYLALALDTLLNYGNCSCRWDIVMQRVRSIFDRHDFAFCWSYSEMAPLIVDLGYDWAIEKTGRCINELVELLPGGSGLARDSWQSSKSQPDLFAEAIAGKPAPTTRIAPEAIAGKPAPTLQLPNAYRGQACSHYLIPSLTDHGASP